MHAERDDLGIVFESYMQYAVFKTIYAAIVEKKNTHTP